MSNPAVFMPIVALVVTVLAFFARDGVGEKQPNVKFRVRKSDFLILAGYVVALGALTLWHLKSPTYEDGLPAVLLSLAAGSFAADIAYWMGRDPWQAAAGRAAPMALAALCVVLLELIDPNAPLAAVFGSALGAWLLSLRDKGPGSGWSVRTSIMILAVYACDKLGGQLAPAAPQLGTMLALAAAIVTIIACGSNAILVKQDNKLSFVAPSLGFALLSLAGYLISRKFDLEAAVPVTFAVATFLALFLGWVLRERDAVTPRVVLSAVLWIALATATFGYAKTLGMAAALMAAVSMAILMLDDRALLTLGPLAALVIYRIFRMLQPDSSELFDIGQHYALIGFLLGVLVPALAIEWGKGARSIAGGKAWSAGGLWVILLAFVPLPIAVALSDKGIVGYMVGLGVAPILEALRGESSALSLSLPLGLSCAMALVYGWMSPHLDLERSEKIRWLAWILGLMAVAVLGIAAISRTSKSSDTVAS